MTGDLENVADANADALDISFQISAIAASIEDACDHSDSMVSIERTRQLGRVIEHLSECSIKVLDKQGHDIRMAGRIAP